MRDSAAKRVFWFIVIGVLMFVVAYGSFVWSLGQTIRFTELLVVDKTFGVMAGIAVQFLPTFFLYMASSFNADTPEEQNQRMWWLAAFWIVSGFDALTNVGARFDRASAGELPTGGFQNEEYQKVLTGLLVGGGILLDIGIVFAEEILGHIISAFFDNLSALITLLGGKPPAWLKMVSGLGRAVGGSPKPQSNRPSNDRNRGKPNAQNRRESNLPIPSNNKPENRHRPNQPSNQPNNQRQRPIGRDIPVNGRGGRQNNVTIRNMIDDMED
jgi:hypothetical protein